MRLGRGALDLADAPAVGLGDQQVHSDQHVLICKGRPEQRTPVGLEQQLERLLEGGDLRIRHEHARVGHGSVRPTAGATPAADPAMEDVAGRDQPLGAARPSGAAGPRGGWGRDRTADLWVMNPPL